MSNDEALEELIATAQERRRAQDLLPIFYSQVRKLAQRERRRWDGAETLQTTALINEAYLKLRHLPEFFDARHFLRSAAIAMRHALISYARERLAEKRGGGAAPLPLEAAENVPAEDEDGEKLLLDVAEMLHRLATISPRLVQVVECRFYAGYSEEETATALGVDARTVRRDWVKARAWLQTELSR
ncbi:MAG: polymerase subunit sigma [Hydrocarboniphaga sp.]|uniref:ECF-type sigma factor n=1 Tax=Hydrocarboniphaga sp. TaxID=2033016 RepID=UPI00262E6086|nr:ECF-type sigma factor [Hydrocarboniphaga sp.]MDB5967561.1 polymerase subunit sigma [Hydrocarboniphaga sp.]